MLSMKMNSCSVALALVIAGVSGCSNPEDTSRNVFPDLNGGGGQPDVVVDADGSGGFPAAFRFDCIKVQTLGSVGATDFQAQLLGNQWKQDISDFKLNILFVVESLDADAAAATFSVKSGIGTSASDLCAEPGSVSAVLDAAVTDGLQGLGYADGKEECIDAAFQPTEVEGAVTMDFEIPKEYRFYIYAEDDDGTRFNCTPDDAIPDAVPLAAPSGRFTINADGTRAAGRINGCLTFSEGSKLCSCLGSCSGGAKAECAGCPTGSMPLTDMLIGVESTEHCTEVMGEEAFDIDVDFMATRLPGELELCN